MKQYNDWMTKIDSLYAKIVKDEKAKELMKPMQELIDNIYGDKNGN